MTTVEEQQQEIVKQLADSYRAKGYSVEADSPVATDLRADLVARKGEETVLVEVRLASNRNDALPSLERLAELAESKGWRFVVAVGNPQGVEEVEVPTEAVVRAKIAEASALSGQSTASVLVAWAAFEAATRFALTRAGSRPRKGTLAQTLIQQVAALGLIDSQEEKMLLEFSAERNRLAHGFESGSKARLDAGPVLALSNRLLARQDA